MNWETKQFWWELVKTSKPNYDRWDIEAEYSGGSNTGRSLLNNCKSDYVMLCYTTRSYRLRYL